MKNNIIKKIASLILIISSSQFLCFEMTNISFAKTSISENGILKLVNNEREKVGLTPLSINSKLQESAEAKAKYLLDNNLFDHNTKDKNFSLWIKEAGYKYSIIGENLATDFYSDEEVVNAWIKSSGHKENILNNYTETGISVQEKNGKILIVQIFGRPDTSPVEIEQTIGNHISECLIIYSQNIKQKGFDGQIA